MSVYSFIHFTYQNGIFDPKVTFFRMCMSALYVAFRSTVLSLFLYTQTSAIKGLIPLYHRLENWAHSQVNKCYFQLFLGSGMSLLRIFTVEG
jgi:hypothetical protein